MSKAKRLDDGSVASTGHGPIIRTDKDTMRRVQAVRKVEGYAYKIRKELENIAALTGKISVAYAAYAEADTRVDDATSIHNGLANMLKLIEVQTAAKLRVKVMQSYIMQAIADVTDDDALPFAVQDLLRDLNVSFLDSKLVRAYGELSRVLKEDSDFAEKMAVEIQFAAGELTAEFEGDRDDEE